MGPGNRAGLVLESFKDIRSGVDEVIARLPELRARVARIENRAIFEIPEILERILLEGRANTIPHLRSPRTSPRELAAFQ